MNYYIKCWKNYATFSGRARRKEYWMFILFDAIAVFIAGVLDAIFGGGLFDGLYALASIVPLLAVTVRRLHDTNRSGWWALTAFVPIILLILTVLDSTPGENQYGPNPKEN